MSASNTEMAKSYFVSYECRENGNWTETGDETEEFDDLDHASDTADNADGGDYGPGEYRATVTDETGDVVHTYEWNVDPAQDAFDAATWLIEDEGEFTTQFYGIGEDGGWVKTCRNGGSRGAHSRQEGDGRWSNMASEVEEITLAELLKAMISAKCADVMDAIKIIAKAHPVQNADDLVLAIADEWEWTSEEKELIERWIIEEKPTYSEKINKALNLTGQES